MDVSNIRSASLMPSIVLSMSRLDLAEPLFFSHAYHDTSVLAQSGEIWLQVDELATYHFVVAVNVKRHVNERFAYRIRHAMRALPETCTIDIVNGVSVACCVLG